MILVDFVRISGLRGIKNLEVSLPRVAVLLGQNNAGKTSVIKALQLALGDYSRLVCEEDFHIGDDEKRSREIIVDVRIVPLDGKGKRTAKFEEAWAAKFGGSIQREAAGNQFLALRTRTKVNPVKGNYDTQRFTLDRWPAFATWNSEKLKESKQTSRLESIAFHAIDAQRDIHKELREKTSFIGRVLGSVEYDKTTVAGLEQSIADVNKEAVEKSTQLSGLRGHLDQLNRSFHGSGKAEITPFPKKLRDLSKHFSVHFGETETNSFSMEYHGMGTRSWASLLTVKSFIELASEKHSEEMEPFFPMIAAEEPETHLHPNAQRTLYRQLSETKGQVVLSTHSPYLAAMAQTEDLRCLKRVQDNVVAHRLGDGLSPEETRRLRRDIMHSRGEILFSKALVMCEGETEEQALPTIFENYFGHSPFQLGVNFVGAGGAGNYPHFFRLAKSLDIPLFLFSDGEDNILRALKKHYEAVFGATDLANCPFITILEKTDFEGYLITNGFVSIVEEAITEVEGLKAIDEWKRIRQGTLQGRVQKPDPPCPNCKRPFFAGTPRDYTMAGGHERALAELLDSSKPKYAAAIAERLCKLSKADLPPKIVELFEKIRSEVKL